MVKNDTLSAAEILRNELDSDADVEAQGTDLDAISDAQKSEVDVDEMDEEAFFARYSPARKKVIVFIVSLSCFLSPISSLSFLPAVSIIAERFHTTGSIINVSNAVYCIMMAAAPCLFGPWGHLYGKRFSILLCLTLFTIMSILTAVSQNLGMFFVVRALSALFGTPFFSLGASVIGDIYRHEERGTGMGWVLSGTQIGPAIGPIIGGIVVTYTSWRVIFWVQTGLAAFDLIIAFFLLPETGRGIIVREIRKKTGKKVYWINYNPFRVIIGFKYKNLILAAVLSSALHYNMYASLTPIRYVVDPRFNLTSPIYGALFYLAPGMGYLIGSLFGGRFADYYVKKYIKIRGRRVPEDRLRSIIVAYVFGVPGCILIYGWSLEKEVGGMPVPIIFLFLGAVAQTIAFPSINTYCVDSMPHLKGDAISGNYFIRFIFAAIGTATVLTEIEHIGIGWTCTVSAGFLCLGSLSLFLLIEFGEKLRGVEVQNEEPEETKELEETKEVEKSA